MYYSMDKFIKGMVNEIIYLLDIIGYLFEVFRLNIQDGKVEFRD